MRFGLYFAGRCTEDWKNAGLEKIFKSALTEF
jgi:hypothetical protein